MKKTISFDKKTLGLYTEDQINIGWNNPSRIMGAASGRTEIAEDPLDSSRHVLQIKYPKGKVGQKEYGGGKKTLIDCDNMSDVEKRNACYVGVVGKNTQLCNTLSVDSRKVACLVHVAINNKKPSLCELAEDSSRKDQCYLGYAGWTKTKGLCDKIQSSNYQQLCYSNVNN